ncbi:MAG: nucleotidyl transferase AbiEii/AbiGii toxin family protein [Solobacterium sp.]|nr:nucleotidyl transferase AbiEii/AbiGii toxin family protein [Solobacterium sp.]
MKIEATSFTISEPVQELEISPIIYDFAEKREQNVLQEMYDVFPFSIMTITMERIFIDKLFAAEAYVRRSAEKQRAFEAAKHIYDLSVMIQQKNIQNLFADDDLMKRLLDIRIQEEKGRLDGIPGILPDEFIAFEQAAENEEVRNAYGVMQSQYVLRPDDRIPYDLAMEALREIKQMLMNNRSWRFYRFISKQ